MADAVTGWTDDRVELLGRLWGEGLSASQIAATLGGGVTRNAVIGKVHRLGMSGRAKSGQPVAQRPTKPRPPSAPGAPGDRVRPAEAGPEMADQRPSAQEAAPQSPTPILVRPAGPVAIPVSERVSILELRDSMCRWPLGDPTSQEFGFCGSRTASGLPYCDAHCRIAYQPAAERKRLRA